MDQLEDSPRNTAGGPRPPSLHKLLLLYTSLPNPDQRVPYHHLSDSSITYSRIIAGYHCSLDHPISSTNKVLNEKHFQKHKKMEGNP